jgi:hypothetical protein
MPDTMSEFLTVCHAELTQWPDLQCGLTQAPDPDTHPDTPQKQPSKHLKPLLLFIYFNFVLSVKGIE